MKPKHAIVSIHDVMPHAIGNVRELLGKMAHLAPESITLLVVPGLDWADHELQALHEFQNAGYRLAGHGWHHRVRQVKTLYHHFHSGLISRMAAEHLSLSTDDITRIMEDCHAWFLRQSLAAPDLYVPPAWAMGSMPRSRLEAMPFRYFETMSGLYDSASGREVRLPLLGFEADTTFRAVSLKYWNAFNFGLGSQHRPVRLSIHPRDHQLLLRDALDHYLGRIDTALPYTAIF